MLQEGTLSSRPRAEESGGWLPVQVTTRGWEGVGRVIVQHTEVNRVGPRTQCLGQKQPGRNKRKLLTRASRKRRGGLGSEELLT